MRRGGGGRKRGQERRVQKGAGRRCWRVLTSSTVHTLLLSLGCMVLRSTLKPTGCSSRLHPEVGQPTHDPAHRNSRTNEHTVSLYKSHMHILVCSACIYTCMRHSPCKHAVLQVRSVHVCIRLYYCISLS